MSSIQDLDKLSFTKILMFIFVITSLVCPGMLIILFFAPSLIVSLSTTKLIILAISFTSPVFLFNLITISAFKEDFFKNIFISCKDDVDKEFLSSTIIYVCLIYTVAIICFPLLFAQRFSWNWQHFLWTVILLQLVMDVSLGIILRKFFKYSIFNNTECGMKKRVIARLFIKNEHIDAFKKEASVIIQKTRSEQGCLIYRLLQDTELPGEFLFYEEYRNQAALDIHFKSEYLATFRVHTKPMCAKESIVEVE